MIINLENLDKYSTLTKVICHHVGNVKADSFYFDFDEKKILFQNSLDVVLGYVSFKYEKEENEITHNFYVSISKLLSILKISSIFYLDFVENEEYGTFSPVFHLVDDQGKPKKDSFQLMHIMQEQSDYNDIDIDSGEFKTFTLTENIRNEISSASKFRGEKTSKEDRRYSMSFILLENDNIFGMTPGKFYQSSIPFNIGDFTIKLSDKLIKVIDKISEDMTLSFNDLHLKIQDNDFFSMFNLEKLVFTRFSEDDLNNTFEQESKVLLNRIGLLSILQTLDSFYTTDSKPLRFSFKENEILFSIDSENESIIRSMEVEVPEEMKNTTFLLNGAVLKQTLSVMKTDNINFFVSGDKQGILIREENEDIKQVGIIKYRE